VGDVVGYFRAATGFGGSGGVWGLALLKMDGL